MDLIYPYQYFHTVSKAPTMLISISLDILKLTQLESRFVDLNCLQTGWKMISAGRLESLQRSFLIWGPNAVVVEGAKTETHGKTSSALTTSHPHEQSQARADPSYT